MNHLLDFIGILMNKLSVSSIESCFAYKPWRFESKGSRAPGLKSNNWECFNSKLILARSVRFAHRAW